MHFSERQLAILEIIRQYEPITSEEIAQKMNLSRTTLRPDLVLLNKAGAVGAKPNVGYFCIEQKKTAAGAEGDATLVRDIATPAATVSKDVTVHEAIVALFMNDVGTIYVTDGPEMLAGVVSRKDIIKAVLGNMDIKTLPVAIVMTRMPNIVTVSMDDTVVTAAEKIMRHQVDSIPVVEQTAQGYRILGKISKTNITKHYLSLFEQK